MDAPLKGTVHVQTSVVGGGVVDWWVWWWVMREMRRREERGRGQGEGGVVVVVFSRQTRLIDRNSSESNDSVVSLHAHLQVRSRLGSNEQMAGGSRTLSAVAGGQTLDPVSCRKSTDCGIPHERPRINQLRTVCFSRQANGVACWHGTLGETPHCVLAARAPYMSIFI